MELLKLPRFFCGSVSIVAKVGNEWSIFADARAYTRSNMANFLIQGQTTRAVLVRLVL